MKTSKLVIVLLWFFFLGDAIRQGWTVPGSILVHGSPFFSGDNWSATITLLFPFAIILFAFRKKYLRLSIWQSRAVSGFLIRIKGELLLACYGLLIGGIGMLRSLQLDAPRGAFIVSGYFVNAGIAFLISYFVLRRRGLLKQESIPPPAKP
jgi:hypothetical protein